MADAPHAPTKYPRDVFVAATLVLGFLALVATFASDVFPVASLVGGTVVTLLGLSVSLRSESWGAVEIGMVLAVMAGGAVGVAALLVTLAG